MVKLQLPVGGSGELCVGGGLLSNLIRIEAQTVGVQDEGAVVVQDVRTACLGCIVLGVLRKVSLLSGLFNLTRNFFSFYYL